MGDAARVIQWNGTDLPPELASLSPGCYRLEAVADDGPAEGASADVRFREHVRRWHRETGHLSDGRKVLAHPDYRAIIAMGGEALPWILRELECGEPDLWGLALREITGESIVLTPHEIGDLDAIRRAWLTRAQERGWKW